MERWSLCRTELERKDAHKKCSGGCPSGIASVEVLCGCRDRSHPDSSMNVISTPVFAAFLRGTTREAQGVASCPKLRDGETLSLLSQLFLIQKNKKKSKHSAGAL